METRRNLEEKFIETVAAKEALLYANTAAYLYDRLRKDTSVSYLAQELPTEEIISWLREQSTKPLKEPTDLLRIYVFLVSLTLKDDLKNFREQLVTLDLKHIEWAEGIRNLILSEQVPTTLASIAYQTTGTISRASTASNVSSGIVLASPDRGYR
jgi:hypothetical protein